MSERTKRINTLVGTIFVGLAACMSIIVSPFAMSIAALGDSATGATPRFDARVIILDLSSDKAVYHVGDKINIRVGLHNTGPRDLGVINASPWEGSDLHVTDSEGIRLKPSHEPNTAEYLSSHGFVLGAGKTKYLSWEGQEWSSLDNWGYRIQVPGKYTITGIPLISGDFMPPDVTTVRSNSLSIRVVP